MRCAFWQERSRRSGRSGDGAKREPCFHWAEDTAGEGAPLVDLLAKLEVTNCYVTEEDIAVPSHRLGVGGDGEVCPEGQRSWPRGVGVVLSTATRAPARCAASESAAMSQTSMVGLLGVSIQRSFAPSRCSACAFPAVGARRI